MSLRALAQIIARSNRDGMHTPVLVVPTWLSLRNGFFVALRDEIIHEETAVGTRVDGLTAETRSLRIDWLRGENGLWSILSDPIARKWANRVGSRLSCVDGVRVKFQVTATISRPSKREREIVIGLSKAGVPLSPWARPIQLSGRDECLHS